MLLSFAQNALFKTHVSSFLMKWFSSRVQFLKKQEMI